MGELVNLFGSFLYSSNFRGVCAGHSLTSGVRTKWFDINPATQGVTDCCTTWCDTDMGECFYGEVWSNSIEHRLDLSKRRSWKKLQLRLVTRVLDVNSIKQALQILHLHVTNNPVPHCNKEIPTDMGNNNSGDDGGATADGKPRKQLIAIKRVSRDQTRWNNYMHWEQ